MAGMNMVYCHVTRKKWCTLLGENMCYKTICIIFPSLDFCRCYGSAALNVFKPATYRWELGDFHHGIGSISFHFWLLMKSVNPLSDLDPSYFRNSPSFTLKIDIYSHDVIESIPIIKLNLILVHNLPYCTLFNHLCTETILIIYDFVLF